MCHCSGESGNERFTSLRAISRGDSLREGSKSFYVESEYSWTQVRDECKIGHTIFHSEFQLAPHDFSVCVVTMVSDVQIISASFNEPSKNFVYHRLDLEDAADKCDYLGKEATTGALWNLFFNCCLLTYDNVLVTISSAECSDAQSSCFQGAIPANNQERNSGGC